MDIKEHVLKWGPWSISKAGVIEKCSLQFDYKYGPNKQKELVTSAESRAGVAVHAALEMALGGTDVNRAFRHAADKLELTSNERDELQTFYEQVEKFVKRIEQFKLKRNIHPANVLIERQLGVTTEFKPSPFFGKGVFFRGVVDFAMLTPTNELIIIDHKSGKQKELSYYEAQFKAYCIMGMAVYPQIRGVQTAVNFIATDKLEWAPFVSAETIRTEYWPWLIQYLTKACEKLITEPTPTPTKGWYCSWCGYKPICPLFGGAADASKPKEP